MRKLLYAGSFDPPTKGHLDIIARAAALCDEMIVAVMHNPDKQGTFTAEERVALLEKACAKIGNVRVIAHGGLLVECARENGVCAVVRGVRPLGDFKSEYQMAQVNRMLGGVETLLMTTSEAYASISSSIVRQIASFGAGIERLVPEEIAQEVGAILGRKKD